MDETCTTQGEMNVADEGCVEHSPCDKKDGDRQKWQQEILIRFANKDTPLRQESPLTGEDVHTDAMTTFLDDVGWNWTSIFEKKKQLETPNWWGQAKRRATRLANRCRHYVCH